MNRPTDHDLLLQFSRGRTQDAVAEIVRRHVDWLYSTALRLVRDPALAQDVTQCVFLVLVKKAPTLAPSTPLAPWLFRVLQYVAANACRAETRRRSHESEAAAMHASAVSSEPQPDWSDVAPLLEPAVAELSPPDRAAILLRFYQQLPLADVGATLGVTEDAARKRVARALARFHTRLRKRKGTAALSAAVLSSLLLTHATHAAPAVLASAAAGLSTGMASAKLLVLAKGVFAMLLRSQVRSLALPVATLLCAGILGFSLAQAFAGQPATAATASAPAAATAAATAPGQPLAFDKYDGYFVKNTFAPNAARAFVVATDQAAFDRAFGMGVVMGDRSHRLPAGIFDSSLVVAPIRSGALTTFSDIAVTSQNGVMTVRYTAHQDPPGSATYNSTVILSAPKAGIKTVVFIENGTKVHEEAVN